MVQDNNNEFNILVTTSSDPPGMAGLDTCCNAAVHGRRWRERMEQALREHGLDVVCRPRKGKFSGIGGAETTNMEYTFPVGIGGQCGQISSAEVEIDIDTLDLQTFLKVDKYVQDCIARARKKNK